MFKAIDGSVTCNFTIEELLQIDYAISCATDLIMNLAINDNCLDIDPGQALVHTGPEELVQILDSARKKTQSSIALFLR